MSAPVWWTVATVLLVPIRPDVPAVPSAGEFGDR